MAEKLQWKALDVETVSRESRQRQMVILYPLIENLYQAYIENIQNGLIVGDFPTWYTEKRRQWGRGKYGNAISIPDPRKKNRHGNVTARVDIDQEVDKNGAWKRRNKTRIMRYDSARSTGKLSVSIKENGSTWEGKNEIRSDQKNAISIEELLAWERKREIRLKQRKGDHLQSIVGTRPVLISDDRRLLADLTPNFLLCSLTALNSFPGQIFVRFPSMTRTLCHVRALFRRFHIHQEVHRSIPVSPRFWSLLGWS